MPYHQQMKVMNVLESDVIFQSFDKWCREEQTGHLPRNLNQTVVQNAIAFGKDFLRDVSRIYYDKCCGLKEKRRMKRREVSALRI